EGAQVGEWRTMVEAVDVHTVGLGGDSQVDLNSKGRSLSSLLSSSLLLVIGPQRVVPLCLLASEHPGIVDELRRQVGTRQRESLAGQFVLAQRRTTHALSDRDQD
ncbi:MAG: hydantoinase/oxoprolinase family protein, partial [Planctomycetales bacterium]|nr:hydantoinase/oxoprolinase family protein [Planctomycetales bacterium]